MFKWKQLYSFFVPTFGLISAGGSSGSSSSQQVLTPEQADLLKYQTQQLKDVFMPAYKTAVGGATSKFEELAPYGNTAALNLYNNAKTLGKYGTENASAWQNAGTADLSKLFDPNYEQGQIQAALQSGREATREQLAGQNAMYGAAGGLGSSRMALADKNLYQLGQQRQAAAAAGAQAQVQANRMAAANSMIGAGQNAANLGINASTAGITAAKSPMDLYSQYAAILYGVPQQSTNPNFANTQGTNQQGGSTKFGFSWG